MNELTIAFIGAGNMASAIIGGLVAEGTPASQITATDPNQNKRQQLVTDLGINTEADNRLAAAWADVIVLCVKPQHLQALCADLATLDLSDKLLISIAAGTSVAAIEGWLKQPVALVRCMPNTPALVRQGASGLYANAQVSEAQKQQTGALFEAVGEVVWLADEGLMHGLTALSGSGPAYFFLFIEALEQAAVNEGLELSTARTLAIQTMLGAAELLKTTGVEPATLKRQVMSPGGTTEQAIQQFEQGGLVALVEQAVRAAAQRSRELAGEAGDVAKNERLG